MLFLIPDKLSFIPANYYLKFTKILIFILTYSNSFQRSTYFLSTHINLQITRYINGVKQLGMVTNLEANALEWLSKERYML